MLLCYNSDVIDNNFSLSRRNNFIERNDTMATKFAPGDIVQLKSGGPAMTVAKADDSFVYDKEAITYLCEWFKGASSERASFAEDTLKTYVAPAQP